jgi:serine/threonine protein kinase
MAKTYVGSPYYMSPEQCNELGYNEKSDIWSLGIIIYEMANLSPPFMASNHLALALKIRDGQYQRIPSQYSEELMRVISWMISPDPKDRPSVEDLLNLPNISVRLREKALKKNMQQLQKQQQEIERKEKEMVEREAAIQ